MKDFENTTNSLAKFQTENETYKNFENTDDENEKKTSEIIDTQENENTNDNINTEKSEDENINTDKNKYESEEKEQENNYGIYSRNQTLNLKKQKISFGNGKRHINFLNNDSLKDLKQSPGHMNTFIDDIDISISKFNTSSKPKVMTNIKEESNLNKINNI